MANDLITQTPTRGLIPTNIEEAYRMAKAFALAEMLPKSYGTGDPDKMAAKAFTAMQLGAEVGMSPMQSIQSIAVVNGMPSIWGDAQKAIVFNHRDCIDIVETTKGTFPNDDYTAICVAKRKNKEDVTEEFSVADARKAGLWGKSGTWSSHPKRMLKYKARAFALRDQFPDALKGLTHSAEEMEGMVDITPSNNNVPSQKKERKEATEINEILANQGIIIHENNAEKPQESMPNQEKSAIRPLIHPPISSSEKSITKSQPNNAAKERADKIANLLKSANNTDDFRKIARENEMDITMMPGNLSDEIYQVIGSQKEKFGIAVQDDLFAD